ncbi:Ppx/GppA family phosphatase [Ferrovibrio sp.]|uniref:Ppx/GppA family phosphatase n=1 Tax=Ferrovibrio sp. TaxID=1917215 RepID=UPI00261A294B|nr:Ppx/GppA family phosphatase [Ferrovibrio sp.]
MAVAQTISKAASSQTVSPLPFGVIDVGSNSVRLVVFGEPLRLPTAMFNEKVLCGLGRGLSETGALDAEGTRQALMAIRRFVVLARHMDVHSLQIVATAAVRDASNGAEFVAQIERDTGEPVRVLSGQEEATYSAYGVLSGIPDACGVMGDLGGGSLELVSLDGARLGDSVTLPLGPLRIANLGNYGVVKSFVDEKIAGVEWLRKWKGRSLYAVGGSWRAIARVHMAQKHSPLHIIHQYTLARAEASDFTRLIAKQSKDSLARVEGVPRRRQDSLPLAALVMRRVLKFLEPKDVVFSANGLREGLAYALLTEKQRAEDPLLAYCRHMAQRESRFAEHGAELDRFIAPLFDRDPADRARIRLAAAILADTAWRVHPDYRGEQSLGIILHAPFGAIAQDERAMLALTIFTRYVGTASDPAAAPAWQLLNAEQIDYAQRIGLAMRLGQTLSAGVPGILAECKLRPNGNGIVLEIPAQHAALDGEAVQRRTEALAKALNRAWDVRVSKR